MKRLVLWVGENLKAVDKNDLFTLEVSLIEKGLKMQRLIDQFVVGDFSIAKERLKKNSGKKVSLTIVCDLVHWFQEITVIPDLPFRQQYAHLELELAKRYPGYQEDFFYRHERIKEKERIYFITSLINQKAFDNLTSFLKKALNSLDLADKKNVVMLNPWKINQIPKGNSLVIIPRAQKLQIQIFNRKHLVGFFQYGFSDGFTKEEVKLTLMRVHHGLLNQLPFDYIGLYFDQTLPKDWEKQFLEMAKSLFGTNIKEIRESWFKKKPNLTSFLKLSKRLEAVVNNEKKGNQC